MARLGFFFVYEIMFSLKLEKSVSGDPLGSERVGKVGHNSGLWLDTSAK